MIIGVYNAIWFVIIIPYGHFVSSKNTHFPIGRFLIFSSRIIIVAILVIVITVIVVRKKQIKNKNKEKPQQPKNSQELVMVAEKPTAKATSSKKEPTAKATSSKKKEPSGTTPLRFTSS